MGRSLSLLLLLGLVLAGLEPTPVLAKRIFVPRDHRRLQAALDAAATDDTVWVKAGVYHGPFEIKKRIIVYGEGGADSTILDGGDSVRVLLVEGVRGGGIIGFGIRRGKANSGGGLKCVRDTLYEIRDCNFEKNWETGISVWESGLVSIGNAHIRNNKGGGLLFDHSTGAIYSSEVTDNMGREGAGMSLVHSRMAVPIRQVLFARNIAKGATGGAVNAADSSEVTIVNSTFRENSTDVAGGAVAAMSSSGVNISRCLFEKNRAGTSGAVHADQAGINVGYSVFNQNTSRAVASALGITGRRTANVNPLIVSNTFYKNTVTGEGAALFLTSISPDVRRNIFVVNTDQRAVTGLQTYPRYDCNLIWDPSGGAIGALPSANTLVGDPLFCDAEHGNFKLRDLSPAMRAPCGPIGAFNEKAGCSSFRLQPAN